MENNYMIGGFQVYRRGFLGKCIESNTNSAKPSIVKQLNRFQYNQSQQLEDNVSGVVNNRVEELYAKYTKQNAKTFTFDFHDSVLKTAIDAFGCNDFLQWIRMQGNSGRAKYVHSEFIKDTVRYLCGHKRKMVLENWEPLLNHYKIASDWEDIYNDCKRDLEHHCGNAGIKTIVLEWCKKPNGLSDLLLTLHILFGK